MSEDEKKPAGRAGKIEADKTSIQYPQDCVNCQLTECAYCIDQDHEPDKEKRKAYGIHELQKGDPISFDPLNNAAQDFQFEQAQESHRIKQEAIEQLLNVIGSDKAMMDAWARKIYGKPLADLTLEERAALEQKKKALDDDIVNSGADAAFGKPSKLAPDPEPEPVASKEEQSEKAHAYKLSRIFDLDSTPLSYTVEKLIPEQSFCQIFGDTGTLKTFFTIDLSCCIAIGSDFHGRKVKRGSVIYVCGEGNRAIRKRFEAWCLKTGFGYELASLDVFLTPGPRDFNNTASIAELITAIDETVKESGAPILVIIDTQSRNSSGNPNDEESAKEFIAGCDKVRAHYLCSVLAVHHTGLMDKTRDRGSYAVKCALDAQFRFERDDDDILRVFCSKMKDADEPEPMAFTWHSVDLGRTDSDGNSETSLILRDIEYVEKAKKGVKGAGKNQQIMRTVLNTLLKAYPEGVPDQEWRKACLFEGVPKSSFSENRTNWLDEGVIILDLGMVSYA